ncbi:MAG: DUF2905 domain-containing protein [Thermodesulfobacteria bacterium]|nr:DUF2905 domain-containing protein [Thermodesulfobacteriota bacterium]
MYEIGKMLLIFGVLMVIAGLFMMFLPKIPLIGRLPGDIVIRKGNFTFYFPLATSLLISVILTLLFSIFRK